MRTLPLLLLLLSCASSPSTDDVAELRAWMTGTFSSEAQSKQDPENFFPIRLVMLPIWTDRADGPWLYVEQATTAKPERPYRQRVYRLVRQDDGVIRSEVYALPGDPLAHAGRWDLPDVTPGQLKLRTGCSIFLTRQADGSYVGSTRGKGCESSIGDAAYATSEVTITAGLLTSWDRGWTEDDVQAWGATEGAYRFVKLSSARP
ncbi:MAG: chromophore lyase CpcT/CpeT [Planctomycetota bacterium]